MRTFCNRNEDNSITSVLGYEASPGKRGVNYFGWLFVYISSLPVAHLRETPRRRLVVTGDSARIQDETTESSAWFFSVLGV